MVTKKEKDYLEYLATKTRFLTDGKLTRSEFKSDIKRYRKAFKIGN